LQRLEEQPTVVLTVDSQAVVAALHPSARRQVTKRRKRIAFPVAS
jgi:hypothetical protein